MDLLKRAHIQEHTNTSREVYHWGYVPQILPCTKDAGSCEYLRAVYWMHDTSMLYSFILWAVIGGILLVIVTLRTLKPKPTRNFYAPITEKNETQSPANAYTRGWGAIQASLRKWLLPESFVGFFGHVSRVQLVVLAILLAYLLAFSVGVLAYALTPLTVALSTRESILTLITGIPYQSLNFLHRWTGRIIYIQAVLHTFGWTLIEGLYYQPQPKVYRDFIKQKYMVWGCIAMGLLSLLFFLSFQRVIKITGHEFFRKSHYILAMLYIGACWGHWAQLACWMIASLGIWGLDRGVRFLRTLLIHVGYVKGTADFGFHNAQSSVEYFDDVDGGVVRLEFTHNHEAWHVGQHFFLTFPALTIWQSHPLTVASVPAPHPALPQHTYIVRCRAGETRRLKSLALGQLTTLPSSGSTPIPSTTTPVILTGPYGTPLLPSHPNTGIEPSNLLAIAGGTGISLTLPLVLAATASKAFTSVPVDFIWIVRRAANLAWIAAELSELKKRAKDENVDLRIHVYITQESSSSSSAPASLKNVPIKTEEDITPVAKSCCSSSSIATSYTETYMESVHPSLDSIVRSFLEGRARRELRTRVVASGPAGMGRDLRGAVAGVNDAGRVWRGERAWDVELVWDDRMG
ncbi:putative Ferric/cupric reductase transmembrane component 1 [Glarea lozoyensis 74030]|uniref:Putative Ferric/cupric reductase transmembrane component 1 n=1 Tax=Glarea lozoyensis (strain ATCC 74030 / MF5533) TaxID=1104152 RepID=H0EZ94_GLAL7|nr:putative Ferric/cupric reductase transmembrane component 1 [Glarea lozoyensis 74030]